MKMKGELTITRDSRDTMRMRLEDEVSGVMFLGIEISPKELMLALTSLGNRPCEFELHARAIRNIGKRSEHKIVEVPIPKNLEYKADRSPYVKPYEVDGWTAYLPDASNHHKCVRRGVEYDDYKVSFHRFVGPDFGDETKESGS